jgi:glycosyltransferase involved in cell wall biosynthesis
MMPSILREMRSNRYEVIHAHDATGGFASSIGSPRDRFVYTMHGLAFHPMDWPTPFRQGIELMQRTTMRNAAHVLCTDERTASEVARFRKQVEILSSGVDSQDFSKDMWPVPNEFDGEYYRVLFVGRLAKVKGVDVLLQAIAGIPERDRREMRFVIVGDGPMRGDVIAAARAIREIQYIGAIDHRSVPSYYVHSDAFVLPSLSEGLPISLLEAMASGLPSIASDVGGVKSQIPDCAVLKVPPSNPTALGDAITAMYHDRSARERVARSGLEIVEERFSWERIVDRLDKIYESLA